MLVFHLLKDYLALTLIKAKYEFFKEDFITLEELDQFDNFMQQEFNKQNLNIVISSSSLSSEDFNIINGVIVTTDECYFDLKRLPLSISTILNNKNLIAKFLINLYSEKIRTLENLQEEVVTRKLCKNVK